MILQPQFRDLIEINGIAFHKNLYCKASLDYNLKQIRNEATTEFVFGCASPGNQWEPLLEEGWKEISCMGNWWPTHSGDNRKLTLLWKKNEKFKNLPALPARTHWYIHQYNKKHLNYVIAKDLAGSGCGFKLISRMPEKRLHWRYFTLARLPRKVSEDKVVKLTALGYRKFDEGTMASYWVNGQDPTTFTFENEFKFLGTIRTEGCREYIGE